jgi:hypothetical protein
MRVIARLLVALAVAFPISVAVTAGIAHGDANTGSGPAVLKCMHWKGSMAIAPGISDNPGDQNVSAHGKLYGCNKAGGGSQYTASLVMTQATCANLAMSGVAQFEWANGQHSTAFLAYHPQANEPKKQYVNGSITSGAFQGLIVSAWVRFTEVFNGSGVNCSSGNQLKQIKFSNTQSFQLLTPNIDTTTTIPTTTPNTPPPTVPETNPGTVPETNPGTPTTKPATVIIIRRGRGGVVVIRRRFPTGTLAFTGSSSVAALFALEALIIGGALVLLDPERKQRRGSRMGRRRAKSFLKVTLPE